ncbi:MAG: response regulator, partial [Clostridia bacterium]|nr:response regulator [Clostridia bacterium]
MEKQTVMIIDDIPDNLRILHSILSDNGYRVVAFREGKMAIEAMMEDLPDLILLDIMLPDVNGWDIVRMLRSANKGMPI